MSQREQNAQPGRNEPEILTFRGRCFEVSEDGWVQIEAAGDAEYQISLVHVCRNTNIEISCFEGSREVALERACTELYELVMNHQSRCASCQEDIVQNLLRRRGISGTGGASEQGR